MNGSPVCFGRSGSDYTAAVIANIMRAERVEIWRDVPGIMSADPRLIRNATRIESLTYDEAAELAFFGALILHPRTVDPLREKNIPLMICDITDPNAHTLVSGDPKISEGSVRSVSFTRDIGVVKLKGPWLGSDAGLFVEVLVHIREDGLNLRSVISGQSCIMMIMDRKDLEICCDTLNSANIPGIEEIECIGDHSLIGIVGEGIFEEHGVASRVLQTVARKGIDLTMIAAGPSDVAYYFIVRENDLDEAVSTIHDDLIMEIVRKTQMEHERRIQEKRQLQLHTAS
jgi:aspartate kinase